MQKVHASSSPKSKFVPGPGPRAAWDDGEEPEGCSHCFY